MPLSDTSSVILRRNGVRKTTEEQMTTAQRDAMFQSSANMASSVEPAPLHRSQRIKDLEAKKNNQSRIMQNVVPHTDRTSHSKGKPKRQESRYRNPPPQVTTTGIRKSRVTKRSNSSRVALQCAKGIIRFILLSVDISAIPPLVIGLTLAGSNAPEEMPP
ncbi:hypothetical protein I7I51_02288 [Histoplasma capsulatum]|uniref:Uncharacterized protein n=1 Tax=Ajellomyces capsulatus TaxID=5037 RepID=A0A8A1MBF8_AJECA|nr:hypothetical protein I7I51_02288 [Histoplasma capsulatum]